MRLKIWQLVAATLSHKHLPDLIWHVDIHLLCHIISQTRPKLTYQFMLSLWMFCLAMILTWNDQNKIKQFIQNDRMSLYLLSNILRQEMFLACCILVMVVTFVRMPLRCVIVDGWCLSEQVLIKWRIILISSYEWAILGCSHRDYSKLLREMLNWLGNSLISKCPEFWKTGIENECTEETGILKNAWDGTRFWKAQL